MGILIIILSVLFMLWLYTSAIKDLYVIFKMQKLRHTLNKIENKFLSDEVKN